VPRGRCNDAQAISGIFNTDITFCLCISLCCSCFASCSADANLRRHSRQTVPLPAEAAGAEVVVADADDAFDRLEPAWLSQPPLELSALPLLVVLPASLTCGVHGANQQPLMERRLS
jgi:hypothetical protein